MRLFLCAAIALGAAAPALAQQMNAEAFHKRATALKAKGPLALMEQDEINALVGEATAASQAARNRRQADLKAKRRARFCPPDGKVSIGSTEFYDGLSAIPAAQRRRINMTEATTRIFAARYPCPKR